MHLYVLETPPEEARVNGSYRGADRQGPPLSEGFGPSSSMYELLKWYAEETHWFDTAFTEQGLRKASELVRGFAGLGVGLEIVEVASSPDKLELGRFIGYDAAPFDAVTGCVGESLLGFESLLGDRPRPDPPVPADFGDLPVAPLTYLIRSYFNPRRNAYGLMDDPETLVFLRSVLGALLQGFPNCIEPENALADVFAVGLVDG